MFYCGGKIPSCGCTPVTCSCLPSSVRFLVVEYFSDVTVIIVAVSNNDLGGRGPADSRLPRVLRLERAAS
jgi:hypothetical protein